MFNDQFYHIKQLVTDQIGSVHVDMIRQFQIQSNELQVMMDKYMIHQNSLVQRVQQLEYENNQLKRQTY
ncbi:hypothetical protein pb186bvf_004684 [Paramecium bursaria]